MLIETNWSSAVAVSRSDRQSLSPRSFDEATLAQKCHQWTVQWLSPPVSPAADNVTQSQTQLWSEEWREFLLLAQELLQSDPLLDHLQNAFATVNMAAWFGDINKSNEVYYLQELDLVLTGLRNRPPQLFDDVVMICTVIVGHCECIRTAGYVAGLPHLEAGFRLMAEWDSSLATLEGQAKLERAQVNNRIKAAISCNRLVETSLGWPARLKLPIQDGSRIGPLSQIPLCFQNLHMAANSVESFMLLWLTQLGRSASWVEGIDDRILEDLLSEINAALAAINEGLLSSSDFHMLYFLRCHCRTAMCIIAGSRQRLGAVEEEEMETVLTDLEWLMRHRASWDFPGNRIRNSLGFIAPAFFVATHTKNSPLRSKALRYLKKLDVIEGAWNSHLAYRIAEGVAAIEDSLTPPTEGSNGLLKVTAASCSFAESETGQPLATLTLTINQLPKTLLSGCWDCKMPEPEDHEACATVDWVSFHRDLMLPDSPTDGTCQPLNAVLNSWGYFGGNRYPTPYLTTPAATHDRLDAHRAEGCGGDQCCGSMFLDFS